MRRQTILLMLVILLLGIVFSREPRLQRTEEVFLRWLIRNADLGSATATPPALTIVELAGKPLAESDAANSDPTETFLRGTGGRNSAVELALFVQALLEFRPTVLAFEPILRWRESAREEEQILIDQAMRIPKLLLAAEVTATPDPDAPVTEIPGFTQVSGKRGDLATFSGLARQPDEDLRLISTLGPVDLKDAADDLHVPMVFQYRGEVVPSFPLQAAMMWLKVTPTEVKVDIGSAISFPNGLKIPIREDGTALINPNAARNARRIGMSALLLAAQQHETKLQDIPNQIVLARTAANPFGPPDEIAETIATIQTNSFLRRVSWIFDCIVLVLVVAISGPLQRFSRIDVLLGAIALSAAYCLIALAMVSRWHLWLPGFLPIGAMWAVVIFSLLLQKPKDSARTVAVAAPPPVP
jgi:hypothetical protein